MFISKRMLQVLLLFVIFLTILFFLLEMQPGDLSQQYIGNPDIPPAEKARLAARLGLDMAPFPRYLEYMRNFLLTFGNTLIFFVTLIINFLTQRRSICPKKHKFSKLSKTYLIIAQKNINS